MTDYPAIVKWHRDTGSHTYYITDQVAKARAVRAPADAIYQRSDRTWATVRDLAVDHDFREWYEREHGAVMS